MKRLKIEIKKKTEPMKKLILVLLLVITSCKTTTKSTKNQIKNTTTFYFFRHAEKDNDGTKDPNLSPLGLQRATNYIDFFKDIKIDAIYSTDFKRTLNTIKPLAKSRNLEPIIYNPIKIDYEGIVVKHKNQTVLVVGHSNTTPSFVNKIIGKTIYKQMGETNFSDVYKVTIIDSKINYELLKMD